MLLSGGAGCRGDSGHLFCLSRALLSGSWISNQAASLCSRFPITRQHTTGGLFLAVNVISVASQTEVWRENSPETEDDNCLLHHNASSISPSNLGSIENASVASRVSNCEGRPKSKSYRHIQQHEKPWNEYTCREVIITPVFVLGLSSPRPMFCWSFSPRNGCWMGPEGTRYR